MGWDVSYLDDLKIIETKFFGYIKKPELFTAIETSIAEAGKRKTSKFLSDCSNLAGGHSLFDLYEKANEIFAAGVSKDLKEAIILPSQSIQQDKAEFWKTVTNNLGYNVRIFQSREEALEWLKK